MGTKVKVDQNIDDIENWDDSFEDDVEANTRSKLRYNSKRRRDIEDIMEERRLARELQDGWDEAY
jgi:hypothetical protein